MGRPVPRPAHPHHPLHPGVQADPQLGGVLARRPEQRQPATHLRHRVGDPGGARPPPGADRGGAASRSPPGGRRAGPVQLSRRVGVRSPGVPSQGRDRAARAGGVLAAQAHRGGLRVRQHPAHHQGTALHHLGASGVVRRRDVPPHAHRRRVRRRRHCAQTGPGLLPQAHELPDASPDLPLARPFLPRTAAAVVRVRQRVPLREVGRGARPDPGAGHDSGRRPHLLHPRADGRGTGVAAAVRAGAARRLRPERLLPRTVHQGPGEVRGLRRGVGRGHRDTARGCRGVGPGAGARPRRRRVLRTEDLGAGPRRTGS